MNAPPHGYKAYILRVWQRELEGGPVVAASLEDPHSSRQLVFPSLAAMLEYLEQVVGQRSRETEEGKETENSD